ncbi:uncharacterized protein [Malus domestica]|uniref:uncharacterized protein n=1 Tax=Malus domestica TaxID=3750 RepID=UPI003976F82F
MNSPVTKAEQLFKGSFIRNQRHQRLFLNLIVRMANLKFSFWKFMFLMLSSRKLNCLVHVHNKMSNSGYILDIKMGYHMSIRDKGGTNFLFSFESILASYKDSAFCVVIDRDKCGTISQRLFNLKSKNKDCVLGSHWSKVFKCEVSFDSSMIIDGEDAGYLGLHHLEACIDKNRKNGSKFTFSRFETSFCVVVHCDMCYCKGIRDKGGDSKFRKSAGDEENMVNLYFNRIGWSSSLPTNEESFVKNVLQKKKMAMDEFLMSEKLTLQPGVEEFIDDAYKEGIHVVLLTTYSKSGDQIGRSIVEKLGKERISKLKIVGYKEVDLSLYT